MRCRFLLEAAYAAGRAGVDAHADREEWVNVALIPNSSWDKAPVAAPVEAMEKPPLQDLDKRVNSLEDLYGALYKEMESLGRDVRQQISSLTKLVLGPPPGLTPGGRNPPARRSPGRIPPGIVLQKAASPPPTKAASPPPPADVDEDLVHDQAISPSW